MVCCGRFASRSIQILFLFAAVSNASSQSGPGSPLANSISTPRPINPAEGTTTPSARITQSQNPYLGSVPLKATGTQIELSLQNAIQRGLQYNLGLIESGETKVEVRAARLRSLSALLPQLSVEALQAYEDISFKEIGIKLPPISGFRLAPTSGGFGYQDARLKLSQSVYSGELHNRYRARKSAEATSALDVKDARDVVVFAVGIAYVQLIASEARLETAKAQFASAQELDQQTSDQVKAEIAPEIDSLRAQVELQSAEQRVTNASNQLQKDRLALGRIIGLAAEQDFVATHTLSYYPQDQLSQEIATAEALRSRSDLASAQTAVQAAQYALRASRSERLPTVSVNADYGGGGTNIGSFNHVYTISGSVSVPVFTGGRISADVDQAKSDLARRQAEYEDLKGRVSYDIRVAWLDLSASDSSVKVAGRNKALAERALAQSKDRYISGVTNYLEVVQAQETVTAANENYIQSLFSFNVAMISLARAMGNADARIPKLLGGN